MLIASLPPIQWEKPLREVIEHPCIGAVRHNTGTSSPYEPREVVRRIQSIARASHTPLYIDLKGKQLRIVEWATMPEGCPILNHRVVVELPAKVYFRGDDPCDLREVVDGNRLFVEPYPKAPVGRGQAINIIGKKVVIEGGLLDLDRDYIRAAVTEGVTRFLLSFVENMDDVKELEEAILSSQRGAGSLRGYELVLKIESRAGMQFVEEASPEMFQGGLYRLMAARDDLMIHIGALEMPQALEEIVTKDPEAICASRLLLGLETGGVAMADVSDLEFMRALGYRHFMLSDGISRDHFADAVAFWQAYEYGLEP